MARGYDEYCRIRPLREGGLSFQRTELETRSMPPNGIREQRPNISTIPLMRIKVGG